MEVRHSGELEYPRLIFGVHEVNRPGLAMLFGLTILFLWGGPQRLDQAGGFTCVSWSFLLPWGSDPKYWHVESTKQGRMSRIWCWHDFLVGLLPPLPWGHSGLPSSRSGAAEEPAQEQGATWISNEFRPTQPWIYSIYHISLWLTRFGGEWLTFNDSCNLSRSVGWKMVEVSSSACTAVCSDPRSGSKC